MIEGRLRAGRWLLVARGVYALPGAEDDWLRRMMGACLEAGADAVASHEAAARLHGLATFRDAPVVVLLGHGNHQHLKLGRLRQATDLQLHHRSVACGIPVTTVARTVADLAGVVRSGRLRVVVENALAAKACGLADLADCPP